MHCYIHFLVFFSPFLLLSNSASTKKNHDTVNKIPTRTWDEAITLAKEFVGKLTLEEKCNMTAGAGHHGCVGFTLPIPRLNFSGLCFQDAPSGIGDGVLFVTAFAPGIQIAASWDHDLFYRRAAAIGQEYRGKGIHFALGPMINIARNALHGRNWEGFGADPYLAGENAFYYVQGLQDQGVVATAKHYICNEQETNRTYFPPVGPSQGYSVNLDDKTMHEIYLWPFAASVAAGVGSVMCAYNQVNGTQACENSQILNGLLKEELEFLGNVMSDWGATKTGIPSVVSGLDINMPGMDDGLMGSALLPAVKNGSLTEARINDMAVRILAPYFLLGQDQNYPSHNVSIDVMDDHYLINREIATGGMILLKNIKNALPFRMETDKHFSLYGTAVGPYSEDIGPHGIPRTDGAIYQGGGSGYVRPSYFLDPLSTFLYEARELHLQIQYVLDPNDHSAINSSLQMHEFSRGKCVVFLSAYSEEGHDRQNLSAYRDGDKLVQFVASLCPSTIVIVNSVAQLNLEAWIDHPNVEAVLWTGLPGSEYGPALLDVLFGRYNPGGKLVFTLAKNDSDYGTNISLTDSSNYTEGVFLDYRHFDRYNITPRYHFGFGLSYTTFSFTTLIISKDNGKEDAPLNSFCRRHRIASYTNKALLPLYEPVYTITFTIKNIGDVTGSEVAQLYLGFPKEAAQPYKILRGFERIYLQSGESKMVSLSLTERDISYWNVVNQKWSVAPGNYSVWISTSANNGDIKLHGSFNI